MIKDDKTRADVLGRFSERIMKGVLSAKKECVRPNPDINVIIAALDSACEAGKEILRPYVSDDLKKDK